MSMPPCPMSFWNSFVNSVRKLAISFSVYSMWHTNSPIRSHVIRRLSSETSARLRSTWDLSTPASSLLLRRSVIGIVQYATLSAQMLILTFLAFDAWKYLRCSTNSVRETGVVSHGLQQDSVYRGQSLFTQRTDRTAD